MAGVSVAVTHSPPQPHESALFIAEELRVTDYANGRQTISR